MARGGGDGDAPVLLAQLPQNAGDATLTFLAEPQLGWAYVACRIASQRLACYQGARSIFQYRTADAADGPRLQLGSRLGAKNTKVSLKTECR